MLAALALAGCGTAPLSSIDGQPRTATELHLSPVRIVAVDGEFNTNRTVQVYPGARTLLLEAPPPSGIRTAAQQAAILRVAPCTSYRLGAKRSSALQTGWELVVDSVEPVAGCNPDEEVRRSQQAGKAAGLPASAPPATK